MSQLYNIRYILWVILYRILLYMLYIIYLLIHDINTWYWILIYHYIMHAKPLQSCPTLCHPMNYSLPGSFVCGISQARLLEWVTISFSKGSSWSRDQTWVFCLAGGFFTTEPPGKPLLYIIVILLLYSTLCTPNKQKSQKSPLSSWGTGLGRMSRWYPWSPPAVPVVWSVWDWGIRTVEPVWGLEKPVPCLQSAFCPGPGLWLLSSLVGTGSAQGLPWACFALRGQAHWPVSPPNLAVLAGRSRNDRELGSFLDVFPAALMLWDSEQAP